MVGGIGNVGCSCSDFRKGLPEAMELQGLLDEEAERPTETLCMFVGSYRTGWKTPRFSMV